MNRKIKCKSTLQVINAFVLNGNTQLNEVFFVRDEIKYKKTCLYRNKHFLSIEKLPNKLKTIKKFSIIYDQNNF